MEARKKRRERRETQKETHGECEISRDTERTRVGEIIIMRTRNKD